MKANDKFFVSESLATLLTAAFDSGKISQHVQPAYSSSHGVWQIFGLLSLTEC